MIRIFTTAGLLLLIVIILTSAGCIQRRDVSQAPEGETIEIFKSSNICFNPDQPDQFATATITPLDNGRIISTIATLPEYEGMIKITAHVTVHPIPKDELSVYDSWDRAGNVRLSREGQPDIEIVKFITAYGGVTEYEVDVSHLAPLLRGPCTFKGFIDTWLTPAWMMDFSLTFTETKYIELPAWVEGVLYEESFDYRNMGMLGKTVEVDIPNGMKRITMNYLVSGHCTDGRDADEFVSKDNVIFVDDREVYRFKPWRDDCRQYRAINPYCRRWSDGTWSSDYSRSGWCPGDKVDPAEIDLTPFLTSGKHTIRFAVDNIRPIDELGHFGYWRISSHLLGWTH